MLDGEMLKYGKINESGAGANMVPVTMAAAQAIKAKSGRFVYENAGAATLVGAAVASIFGVLNAHEHTPDVGVIFSCDADLDGVWRIPIKTGTFVIGMVGDYCDLVIDTEQGADLTVSTRNHVVIVNGDAVNNKWVDVKMNPQIWGTGAGADD